MLTCTVTPSKVPVWARNHLELEWMRLFGLSAVSPSCLCLCLWPVLSNPPLALKPTDCSPTVDWLCSSTLCGPHTAQQHIKEHSGFLGVLFVRWGQRGVFRCFSFFQRQLAACNPVLWGVKVPQSLTLGLSCSWPSKSGWVIESDQIGYEDRRQVEKWDLIITLQISFVRCQLSKDIMKKML